MLETGKSRIATGLAAAALSIGPLVVAPSSSANTLLIYDATVAGGVTATATTTGCAANNQATCQTTISIVNLPVSISFIATGGGPFAATLNMTATSTNFASLVSGSVQQNFTGSFTITNGATNYLSGNFIDLGSGTGNAFSLNASTPPGANVSFTSNVMPAAWLGLDRAVSFAFTNWQSPASRCGGATSFTLCSATANNSGSMSSQGCFGTGLSITAGCGVVPEPATLPLLALGLVGLVFARRRQP